MAPLLAVDSQGRPVHKGTKNKDEEEAMLAQELPMTPGPHVARGTLQAIRNRKKKVTIKFWCKINSLMILL